MSLAFRLLTVASLFGCLFVVIPTNGESPDAKSQTANSAKPAAGDTASKVASNSAKLTVAVLDFSANDPGNPELGRQLGEAIAADLSGKPGITLVDRQSMRRTIQEQSLNLTGLVDSDQAVKVGKLVGARLLITGSAFTLGKQLTITAKLIGTETSQVDSIAVKGVADADLGDLATKLSAKLVTRISEVGPKLVAAPAEPDPLTKLQKRFSGRKLPTIAVIITEEHHGAPVSVVIISGRAIDPPVETELKQALVGAGFTVQDVPQNDLAKFARNWKATDINSWPRSLAGVDLLITGESFSEFGARIGDLTSCSARTEINIISRRDGKIIQADKVTARAADLSENIAAKGALEKAGHQLAVKTLEFFDRALPEEKSKAHSATTTKP